MATTNANSPRRKTRQAQEHGPILSPGRGLENDDDGTPPIMMHHRPSLLAPATLRHVTRVSKRAALATKKQIWDSNAASIIAAQSAVDQWEQGYNALRGLLNMLGASVGGLYGAAKAGATGLEHGLLVPVRDWILLPAFGGVEHIAVETIGFLQSEQCRALERAGLGVIQQVPYVGENILAPAVCTGADILKQTWKIAQYPIPSPTQVRENVEFVMTGTKWCLAKSSQEIMLYAKRADANITRTISHTQWKVLGSGPYATLNTRNKEEVIDHICERYFSMEGLVARYELAAHIRTYNRHLYRDLVLTGLLRERGGQFTSDDEWLSASPIYRTSECSFLLGASDGDQDEKSIDQTQSTEVMPLWFRLPNHNGRKPSKDTPWKQFSQKDGKLLEEFYHSSLEKPKDATEGPSIGPMPIEESKENDNGKSANMKYETVATWYDPDMENDLLIDQKRYAVSAYPIHRENGESDALEFPPPLSLVMRPTLWRFHGPGDELRRAVWFMDTKRHGLQPYSEGAQAVLEDAYMFLKWITEREPKHDDTTPDGGILLTVEVPSPDESEYHLVQFSSLTSATAIGKGLKGAISLFKRRVYRGAYREVFINAEDDDSVDTSLPEELAASTEDYDPAILDLPDIVDESELDQNQEFLFENYIPDPSFLISKHEPKQDKSENQSINEVHDDDAKEEEMNKSTSLAFCLDETSTREDEASALEDAGGIDHLVLVVHGIGEMMINVDLFGISKMPTIIDCCDFLRDNHAEVLNTRFTRRGRVEYLPVEWHEAFSIETKRRSRESNLSEQSPSESKNYTINDVALRTIPQLRQFANDTLMDVLYFMSPEHHDIIIDIVVNEMNFVVERFKALTGFSGDTSVVGHSLGSIITWDILENQRVPNVNAQNDRIEQMLHDIPERTLSPSHVQTGSIASEYSHDNDPESISPFFEEKAQKLSTYPQLSFNVNNAFMLGSPIAVFLMIRNPRKPLSKDFTLGGCSQIFNIFHPYDPVAYRIEPLLDPRNADIEPRIMSHWHGGYRFQYQTKRLWRRIVAQTLKTQETVVEGLESGFAALGLLDGSNEADDSDDEEEVNTVYHNDPQVDMGSLNRGQRIDHMLQEREIESANEYVAALAAHSSYWLEKDLSLFIAHQICLRSLERETDDPAFAKDMQENSS